MKKPKTQVPILIQKFESIDDNGFLRSRGRSEMCQKLNYNVSNPIVLPKDSHLTKLFIWEFHSGCKHLGANTTLHCLRNSGLWVHKGRSTIKKKGKKSKSCVICKKN